MASVELEAAVSAKNLKMRFNTANEVTSFLTRLMSCLQRSRSALVNPKKRTLEDLRSSKHAVRTSILNILLSLIIYIAIIMNSLIWSR